MRKRRIQRCKQYKLVSTELIGLEAIQDMIELVIFTRWVKGEKTVSVIFLAEPESGKTEMQKKYRNNAYHRRTVTAYRMIKDLLDGVIKIPDDKNVGHVIVYDISDIFAHKHHTVDQGIQFFCAFIEEGLSPQGAYWIGTEESQMLDGVHGGLIAGANQYGFFTKRGYVKTNLFKGGFISRLLIFSFDFSLVHLEEIFKSIRKQKYRTDKDYVDKIDMELPDEVYNVRITASQIKEIEHLARVIDLQMRSQLEKDKNVKARGIRLTKILISMAKASALRDWWNDLRDTRKVTDVDIGRIKYLSRWMNLEMKELDARYPRSFGRFA